MRHLLAILLLLFPACASAQATRALVDDTGRRVFIPANVAHVVAPGHPANIAVYMVAPEKLLGWVRQPGEADLPFIAEPYRNLPTHGRLTGRGNTAVMETVLAMKPDVIIDVGSVNDAYTSLAIRVQDQTKIPYLLFDGSFAKAGYTLRRVGEATGDTERANALAVAAEEMLAELKKRIDAVPADRRPRVYYGRGPRGLETGTEGSINTEVLEAVGAVNVAAAPGQGNLASVSMEQILAWNPDVILTLDKRFYAAGFDDPLWQSVPAVKNKRVYLSPSTPFGWLDFPPGLNRLIGARWLAAILYPDIFPEDLRGVTRDFYARFYHVNLTDDQLGMLLAGTAPTRR